MPAPPNPSPSERAEGVALEDRVPIRQKVGYGLGTFADIWGKWFHSHLEFQVFNIYLGVAPWLVGVVVILGRTLSAVADLFFGWASDNSRTRWGRRRPFMFAGTILAGIGLPFLVAVGPGWGSTHLPINLPWAHQDLEVSNYFWFMLISTVLYFVVVSCFSMPFQSLGAEMTPDYHERTSVFAYKNAVQKIPEVGLYFAGQFFTLSVWVGADHANAFSRIRLLFTSSRAWERAAPGAAPNMLLGAQVFCVLAGIIILLTGFGSVALVRERYYEKLIAGKQVRIPLKRTLQQTLRCRPFRMQVLMGLGYSIGLSMVGTLGAANTFYYVCSGDLAEGNWWNFRMGLAGMLLGLLGIPVFALCARALGKRLGMMCVLLSAIATFAGTWWLYDPDIKWLQLFGSGFIAFVAAGFWTLYSSIGADVVDFDELQTGNRREGAFAACGSLVITLGRALGAGTSFFVLSWLGFDAKLGGNQAGHTLFMIRLLLAVIPIVGLMAALFAIARYPLSHDAMANIRRQLETHRGHV
jgi:GPH family glycoside/pentoside/hexuronide:cation symporter